MKAFLIIFLCLFFFNCKTLAQKKSEIITQCKQFRYCYKGDFYTKESLSKIMVSNDEAYKNYNKFKRVRTTCLISTGVVLAMLGLEYQAPCGGDEDGGDACHTRRGIVGLLAAAVALPTFFIYKVKFLKSIRLFNEAQGPSIGVTSKELDFKYTGNGVGLVLSF